MLKQKSFWTGVLTICGGIGMIMAGDTATGVQTIAIGASTIFLRSAISKVGK